MQSSRDRVQSYGSGGIASNSEVCKTKMALKALKERIAQPTEIDEELLGNKGRTNNFKLPVLACVPLASQR